MRIINYDSIPSNANQTKTVRTFGAWLGEKPQNMQAAVLVKPEYTANMLLDAVGSVYGMKNVDEEYSDIQGMKFQWQVDGGKRMVKVRFAESCTETGQGKRDVRVVLDRKYYDRGDTFRLKNGQLLFVRMKPRRLGENRWEHIVTLVTNNVDQFIDVSYMRKGAESWYISNYHPELSERGYSKWTFNAEKHINYISRHRHSDSWSGDYANQKNIYYKSGKEAAGNAEFIRFPEVDKNLWEQFLQSRAGNLTWGVCNYDANGKCLDQEEDGRDIPMGDGFVTQFARYCDRVQYHDNEVEIEDLDDIVYMIQDKTGKSTGNVIAFVINRRLFRSIDRCLKKEARSWVPNTIGAQFVKPDGNGLRFGNYFNSYTVNNNVITFMVDDSLTQLYPERGFGMALDASMNEKGKMNMTLITMQNLKYITGTLNGMGGQNGSTDGVQLATSVHGSEFHVMGYSGVCVHNPYAAVMMFEATTN